jgi:hypothetical protein
MTIKKKKPETLPHIELSVFILWIIDYVEFTEFLNTKFRFLLKQRNTVFRKQNTLLH